MSQKASGIAPKLSLASGMRFNDFFADAAERLRFTDRNPLIRGLAIGAFCLAPFAIALLNLPEFSVTRSRIGDLSSNYLVGAVFNMFTAAVATLVTLFAVICINRGWARSEQLRESLVIKNRDDSVRCPPDLRGSALLSAAILIVLTPLILFYSNELSCRAASIGCLFSGSGQDSTPWLTAADITVQTLTFSIPQEVFRYPNFSSIVPIGEYGRSLEIVLRVLVQIVFVACIFELARISRTIDMVVAELRKLDHVETRPLSPAFLQLGSRLVPRLCNVLEASLRETNEDTTEDVDHFAHNAANAIGQIGDPSAIPTLKRIFQKRSLGSWPRQRALVALAALAQSLRQKESAGVLRTLWNRFVLLRLRLWCWIWIKREARLSRITGRPAKLVRDALDKLFAATRA